MRFRYLIAVPFDDHGSDLLRFHRRVMGTDEIVTITPKAPISSLDYSIHQRSFEQLPRLILGDAPAEFSFEPATRIIAYRNFPSPQRFFEYFLDAGNLRRYLELRGMFVGRLYNRLANTTVLEAEDDKTCLIEHVRTLLAEVMDASPYLMASVCVDEYAFQEAFKSTVTDATRKEEFYNSVLKTPYARLRSVYPSALLEMKRITLPCREYYTAQALPISHLSGDDAGPASSCQQSSETTDMEIVDRHVSVFRLARAMYESCEELAVLWGSVMSQLSFIVTRLAPPSAYAEILSGTAESLCRQLREGWVK